MKLSRPPLALCQEWTQRTRHADRNGHEASDPGTLQHRHDVEGAMLKRIVLTTLLLISISMTLSAKVSLLNIREPEAAVEETLMEAEQEHGNELIAPPVDHCKPREAEFKTTASGQLEKASEPVCPVIDVHSQEPAGSQSSRVR
jgi:hypothetical protein